MARRIRWLCRDMVQRPKTLCILLVAYISFFLNIRTKPIKLKVIDFNVNKSFIRWGDGETLILLGISFSYQKASIKLSNEFKKIFYYKGEKIILGMPLPYISKPEKETEYLRARLITRYYFNNYLDKHKYYGDAFYFINLGDTSIFKKLYKGKNIFIVANKETIQKIKKSTINEMVIGYNEIPTRNAYAEYDKTKSSVLKKIEFLNKENLIVIISSGPTAKVLAYDLTINNNLICHDVGSYFDRNL